MNPYQILGVPSHADNAALRAAYRGLVRLHHPDLASDEAARQLASERMVNINWAWHIVSDANRRAAFDAQWHARQIEAARRQQEALRAQTQGQVVRGAQAHLNDVLQAQAQRRQQQNQQRASETAPENGREQQFLEWQALERARRERESNAKSGMTRAARQRLGREEKKRQALARARVARSRREDRARSSKPSARQQLAEAARLFGQEGRAGEAIAICHDVLRVDFRNVPARELLGDFYLRLGREDRALPLWEQALVLQPGNLSVRRKLHALRPHDPNSYEPRPSRSAPLRSASPRSASRSAVRPTAATSPERANSVPENASFWGRVREAFRSGL